MRNSKAVTGAPVAGQMAMPLGNLDLSQTHSSDDRVFFNIWPGLVVHYPETWVTPLTALATVLIGGLSVFGLREIFSRCAGLSLEPRNSC